MTAPGGSGRRRPGVPGERGPRCGQRDRDPAAGAEPLPVPREDTIRRFLFPSAGSSARSGPRGRGRAGGGGGDGTPGDPRGRRRLLKMAEPKHRPGGGGPGERARSVLPGRTRRPGLPAPGAGPAAAGRGHGPIRRRGRGEPPAVEQADRSPGTAGPRCRRDTGGLGPAPQRTAAPAGPGAAAERRGAPRERRAVSGQAGPPRAPGTGDPAAAPGPVGVTGRAGARFGLHG